MSQNASRVRAHAFRLVLDSDHSGGIRSRLRVGLRLPGRVRCRLYSTRLTDGQRAALELIATTTNRVVGVQGYAGTGKSRMLEQAKALVEGEGHKVIALAPYATQVRALRELGVEARTLASFLAAREKDLDPNTLLVIDEAGTVPTRQMEQAMRLAGTNEARREINSAIREDLGLAGQGREYSILVRRDTTQAERAFAKNYSPGELAQPERDYPRLGLQRGVLYEVTENGPGNRLTLRDDKGKVVEFTPRTQIHLSVYEPERAELARGDRVRITRNDAALDLANGDRFTVAAADKDTITVRYGNREVVLPADRPLHVDHAYATTVHSSQGTTAERVLIDAAAKSRTTDQDVYYVAISRARQEARIYTDDRAKLPLAIAREHTKHAAMDLER